MLEQVVARWHEYVESGSPEVLASVLDDDVVFLSPVRHTPQRGRAVTTGYLLAARDALAGDASEGGRFRYTKQVLDGDVAVLEFETGVDGRHVNGVDIITVAGDRIVEFRVMVRPLQAVEAVLHRMQAVLAAAQGQTVEQP